MFTGEHFPWNGKETPIEMKLTVFVVAIWCVFANAQKLEIDMKQGGDFDILLDGARWLKAGEVR